MAVLANTTIPSRRGFLAALAKLPLIGGGVMLLGQPSAAAVPMSSALLRTYVAFLGRERQAAQAELAILRGYGEHLSLANPETWRSEAWWMQIPGEPAIDALVTLAPASSRAAVVMAAAGLAI